MSIFKNTLLATCFFTTVGLIPLLQPQTAMACSCMRSTSEEQLERADVAFKGRVIDKKVATLESDPSGGLNLIRWTFVVEDSQKGAAAKELIVESASNSAACGINFQMGERYQVFANQHENNLRASLCSGTQLMTEEGEEQSQESTPEPSPCAEDHSNF